MKVCLPRHPRRHHGPTSLLVSEAAADCVRRSSSLLPSSQGIGRSRRWLGQCCEVVEGAVEVRSEGPLLVSILASEA